MAIGAVVWHRNFVSFIGPGRVRHGEAATTNQRGDLLGVSAAQRVNKKMFCSKLYLPRGLCGYTYNTSLHTSGRSNSKFLISKSPSHVEDFLSVSQLLNENFIFINRRQRMRGICKCSPFSACFDDNSIQPRKLDKLSFIDRQLLSSKHTIVTRTRADFKSEEHDITGTKSESVRSSEMASEAVLLEGNEQSQPWWKQLPKRWVIVMLCFASFLLCNMDRVNMSIAILPMSKEFNWNSATVGLIQSSFFWGYLLTQEFQKADTPTLSFFKKIQDIFALRDRNTFLCSGYFLSLRSTKIMKINEYYED